MTIEERKEAAKWFQNRAIHTTMPGAKMMFKRAAEALSEGMQPHWIPCSERRPNSEDFVIVTILDDRGDTAFRYSDFGWYLNKAGCWMVDAEVRTDVIAWMPLPEPYGGESE